MNASSPEDREALLSSLAKVLYSKMEHLDPTGGPAWENMSYADREFYVACAEAMLVEFCSVPVRRERVRHEQP